MPSAPRTDDESGRLEALRRYKVLGTPPEAALDDLTKLAACVCQTPMSVMSLVDEHRQWFKSRFGIAITETPRDLSFCAHALHDDDLMVVEDARADPRFADHPFVVTEPGIRFYAGAPLRTPDGHALGTLCVFDDKPRRLTDEQRHALRVLGRQAMAQLELRRQAIDLVASEAHALSTITERRRAEEALREKTIQLEAALGIARMGVWFGNVQTDEVFTVHSGGPVSGLPPAVAPTSGTAFMQLVHPDDRAAVGAKMALAAREGAYDAEFRIVLPDGEVRWVSARGQYLKDATGTPTFLTGVDLDITERKRAEERITHLNRVYAVLSDINQAIVREPDLDGVLNAACHIAVEKGGFVIAWIGLFDPATGRLTRRAAAGADDRDAGDHRSADRAAGSRRLRLHAPRPRHRTRGRLRGHRPRSAVGVLAGGGAGPRLPDDGVVRADAGRPHARHLQHLRARGRLLRRRGAATAGGARRPTSRSPSASTSARASASAPKSSAASPRTASASSPRPSSRCSG